VDDTVRSPESRAWLRWLACPIQLRLPMAA
jgi:hypothetical protein